jgi:hypothetical protein
VLSHRTAELPLRLVGPVEENWKRLITLGAPITAGAANLKVRGPRRLLSHFPLNRQVNLLCDLYVAPLDIQ